MESITNTSISVLGLAGTKRAASPTPFVSHLPPQRTKHQRNSHETQRTRSAPARSPRSVIWHDFRDQISESTEDAREPDHYRGELTADHEARQEQPLACAPPQNNDENSKIHNFFTKGSIFTPRGIANFQRVQVDERSSCNLLPWSIAITLGLILYPNSLGTTATYCRLTIRVAGVETAINARVLHGLHTILLGREWIESVNLLSDFGNRGYYIPIPLAIEAEEPLNSDRLIDGRPSGDELSLDDEPSSGDDLSLESSSGDEILLGDGPSSDETILDENQLATTNQAEDEHEIEDDEKGEEDSDADSQETIEYHLLEAFTRDAKAADTKEVEDELQLISSPGNQSDCVEAKSERAIFSPHSMAATLTKSQAKGVQTPVIKRQSKGITKILNHVSRTLAGQSFKAPVKQLWPEYANTYAARVLNPIDLGTIEMKVKNDTYLSIDAFRADIALLYQNSVDFNGIEHIITSAALEVRDTILKAISDVEEGKGTTRASIRGLQGSRGDM